MRFTLVPSPLLGPSVWTSTARALRDLGHDASVASADDLPDDPGVLVPHSNAGYWTAGRGPVVYVDAALPEVGAIATALAPPGLLDSLRELVDEDGVLPPWTQWWDDAEVGALFPDAATRATVEAEQPRLPLSWFERRVEVPAGWADLPSAYLAFGDTYATETALARKQDWPVIVIDGGHLQMLHDPTGVAAAIVELTNQVD